MNVELEGATTCSPLNYYGKINRARRKKVHGL